jgi:hypothetical protein
MILLSTAVVYLHFTILSDVKDLRENRATYVFIINSPVTEPEAAASLIPN